MGHYAVIEIGSNAVRMILGVKEDDSTVKVIRSWSSHFRLGQEVFSKGNISERVFKSNFAVSSKNSLISWNPMAHALFRFLAQVPSEMRKTGRKCYRLWKETAEYWSMCFQVEKKLQ